MRNLVIALSIVLTCSVCYASDAGSNTAQFLSIQPGARLIGMGETGVSTAENGNALYWNPALLGSVGSSEAQLTHMLYFQELNYDYVTYCVPVGKAGTLALGILALYSGDIVKTSEDVFGNFVETGQRYGSMETAFMLGWGKRISETISTGISIKSISQRIDTVDASGFAADAGVAYRVTKDAHAGLSVLNVGPQIKGNDVPTVVKLGGDIRLLHEKMTIAVEGDYPMAGKMSFGIGVERQVKQIAAIRLGYNSRAETEGLSGIRFGLGAMWKKLTVDYAFVPYGEVGITHAISIGMKL